MSVLCSYLGKISVGVRGGLRGEIGWAAAVGTVESENLLCKGGKENLVYVKVGNINPAIFLFFSFLFNNFFPCTPPSPAPLLLSL